MQRPPLRPTLFPYTTLFRSRNGGTCRQDLFSRRPPACSRALFGNFLRISRDGRARVLLGTRAETGPVHIAPRGELRLPRSFRAKHQTASAERRSCWRVSFRRHGFVCDHGHGPSCPEIGRAHVNSSHITMSYAVFCLT